MARGHRVRVQGRYLPSLLDLGSPPYLLAAPRQNAQKGGAKLLAKGGKGGFGAFDDLARGLDTGAISRGKAIKLGGAALVASALGLLTSQRADAQVVEPAITRSGCRRAYRRPDFCRSRNGGRCRACCNRESRRPKACCGSDECNCCRRSERCNERGNCV